MAAKLVKELNNFQSTVSSWAFSSDRDELKRHTELKSFLCKFEIQLRQFFTSIKTPCPTIPLYSRIHDAPLLSSLPKGCSNPGNIVNILSARESCGPFSVLKSLPTHMYSKKQMHRRYLGHLSSVYCVAFDRSGKYIFTGADDSLVKIWSAIGGRLLATLRGHSAEITDLAVNYENTLIASGSCDKMIRVWSLRTIEPVTILTGHTSSITSVKFCPYSKTSDRFLISTSNDGSVNIWRWNAETYFFDPKPLRFIEKSIRPNTQILCSSFSPGGCFLAVGSTDHYVRVYHLTAKNGPAKISEIQVHSESVDSIQFSNYGLSFISGSKDGFAYIWWFEKQVWHRRSLDMSELLPGITPRGDPSGKNKIKVNMVCWTCDDLYVITAVNDCSLKVWEASTGKLKHVLTEHDDEVFVLEANPTDPRIFLSGGHDGKIILWDVILGKSVAVFCNQIDGQGPGAIFDCKFSPDGQLLASTDSHGHLAIYGYGSFHKRYELVPDQVFFHTDYRPLIRDANHYVIDEQTQCAPHLMPPPFLVDIDGNPHPPSVQRLVPGRENCKDDQLVPYIAIHNERGVAEVLQPVVPPGHEPHPVFVNHFPEQPQRPTIDDMIERLAQEQARERVNLEHGYAATSQQNGSPSNRIRNHSQQMHPGQPTNRPGPRSGSENLGVRQSIGNWQSREKLSTNLRRVVVESLREGIRTRMRTQFISCGVWESRLYEIEVRKKKSPDSLVNSKDREALSKQGKRRRPIKSHRTSVVNSGSNSIHTLNSTRNNAQRNGASSTISNENENEHDHDITEESSGNESDPSFSGSGVESWNGSSSSSSSSESDSDSEENSEDEEGSEEETPYRNGEMPTRSSTRLARRPEKVKKKNWLQECRELLDEMITHEDSQPFRAPVDPYEYPDYLTVVESPMDLSTIKECLLSGNYYSTPSDFARDVELIFRNSKSYNTDRRSRIYAMTTRLRGFFKEKMGRILASQAKKRGRRNGDSRYTLRNKRKKTILLEDYITNLDGRKKKKKKVKREKPKESQETSETSPPSPSSQPSSPSFDPTQPSTSGVSLKLTSQNKKERKTKKNANNNVIIKYDASDNEDNHPNGVVNGVSESSGSNENFYKSLITHDTDDETDVETDLPSPVYQGQSETDNGDDTDATEIAEGESHINGESSSPGKRKRDKATFSSPRKKIKLINGSLNRESRGSCESSDSTLSQPFLTASCLDSLPRRRRRNSMNSKNVSFNGDSAQNEEVDICAFCHRTSPETEDNVQMDADSIEWINCDACDQWYHQDCVRDYIPANADITTLVFYCPNCKKRRKNTAR